MGQYFKAMITDKAGETIAYSGKVLCGEKMEYDGGKLLEQAWWENPYVEAVAKTIYKNAKRVVWLGDYADDFMEEYPDGFNGVSAEQVEAWGKFVWESEDPSADKTIEETDFSLEGKFLVNHTKKTYVDCDEYFADSVETEGQFEGWCLHPLPLLTCIGNGMGGGDLGEGSYDTTSYLIGAWAYDEISIEDSAPDGYEDEYPIFKEEC